MILVQMPERVTSLCRSEANSYTTGGGLLTTWKGCSSVAMVEASDGTRSGCS
ncbi:hypothetical protein [Paenibacillus antarcticus]|uniref:hypothetical protein n=1 Tax=Paenibacillus antarcticus TaxID=253703 RepID=UPI0012EE5411|nr:hypothetical protein [Paenibacillus antarcticus]